MWSLNFGYNTMTMSGPVRAPSPSPIVLESPNPNAELQSLGERSGVGEMDAESFKRASAKLGKGAEKALNSGSREGLGEGVVEEGGVSILASSAIVVGIASGLIVGTPERPKMTAHMCKIENCKEAGTEIIQDEKR